MKTPVITLAGQTENALIAIDIILANYFKALRSSSTIIQSEICSLIYDIRSAKNITAVRENIINSLSKLMDIHFSTYDVNVEVATTDDGYDLTIVVSAVDNGVTVNVGKLVSSNSTSILKVVNINTKGTL